MEKSLRLLIVEDDKAQQEMYTLVINNFNKKHIDINILCDVKESLDDGLSAIRYSIYDGAIIDLKLSGSDMEAKGNVILREIKNNLRFPVVVLSGYIQDLDPDLKDENELFSVYRRTDIEFKDVLSKFVNLYLTGLTKILGKRGIIDDYLNNIFWKYISKNIKYWMREMKTSSDIEKVLLRYTLSHLQEYLEISNDGEDFEKFNIIEMYIIPPIKNRVFTCDIIKKKDSGQYYIVLNPACDMAQGKAKYIVLAEIESANMEFVQQKLRNFTSAIMSGKQALMDESIKELRNLLTNAGSLKYHFLPSTVEFQGGYINFQKLISIKMNKLDELYDRIASITTNFSKDIIARFSHYYARQGQPDFDTETILKSLLQENNGKMQENSV